MQESCKCEKLRRKTISVVPVSHEVLSSKLCYLLCWGPPPCWAAAHCWQWWRCGKCRQWTPAPSWAGTWPDRKVTEQNTYEHYLPASNYTVPFRSLFLFFLILPRQAYYVSSSFPFFAANSFPLTWRSRRFESCLPVWPGPLGHCPKLRHKHEAAGLEIS